MAAWMIPAAGGLLGAIAGSQKDQSSSTAGVNVAPASSSELAAHRGISSAFGSLQGMVNAGANQMDVANATQSSRGLAQMLQQYSQGGFLPSESDWGTARQFATNAFQPQQVAMQQAFQQQNQRAAQLASQLGRPVNDPIIQSRLAQEQMQGSERLGAAQSAYASEYAQNLPMQRLGFAGELANVQNALASQAMANRQALIGLGSQIQGQERDWRLQTATRYGSGTSGGGLKGAISGAIGGVGAGLGAMNTFSEYQLNQTKMQAIPQVTQAFQTMANRPQVPQTQIFNSSAGQQMAPSMSSSFVGPPAPYNGPLSQNYNYMGEPSSIMTNLFQGTGIPYPGLQQPWQAPKPEFIPNTNPAWSFP